MISFLLQVDTAQVAGSGSAADGAFFWKAVGAIVLVVCLGYLLRRLFKTEPAKPLARQQSTPRVNPPVSVPTYAPIAEPLSRTLQGDKASSIKIVSSKDYISSVGFVSFNLKVTRVTSGTNSPIVILAVVTLLLPNTSGSLPTIANAQEGEILATRDTVKSIFYEQKHGSRIFNSKTDYWNYSNLLWSVQSDNGNDWFKTVAFVCDSSQHWNEEDITDFITQCCVTFNDPTAHLNSIFSRYEDMHLNIVKSVEEAMPKGSTPPSVPLQEGETIEWVTQNKDSIVDEELSNKPIALVSKPSSIPPKAPHKVKSVDSLEELENQLGVGNMIAPLVPERTPKSSETARAGQNTQANRQSGIGKTETVVPPIVEKISSTVKYIGYQPLVIPETGMFPKVLMPQAGCVIKFPRVGRSGRRGFKEADFMQVASAALSNGAVKVYNDRHVPTPNALSPYEPDLVVINEQNGLNLFVNIEIDEPYDGVYRQPIHCEGDDNARDEFFTRRGWIVVRFAEIQVHQQPEACCAYVAALVAKLDPNYQVPEALRGQVLQPVSYWDNVQAQKWAKANYREKYLGITGFGRREEQAGMQQAAALAVEEEVEELVDKTAPQPRSGRVTTGRLEEQNAHTRDAKLQFDPEAHQYLIEGQPATAVSTLVDRFFPEFDKHYWAPRTAMKRGMTTEAILAEWDLKGKTSAALGTRLHEHIEDFYDTGKADINLPEFKQFLNFHGDHGSLMPHRTEWRVFNEDMMIAGTLDFVAQHADGTVSIYDWKRSEKVINKDGSVQQNFYQTAEGPLGDLDDSKFSRYSIQQNLYKWLLESKYDIRVRSMHLVVLHPGYPSYTVLDVPDRAKHVEKIVKSLQSIC